MYGLNRESDFRWINNETEEEEYLRETETELF